MTQNQKNSNLVQNQMNYTRLLLHNLLHHLHPLYQNLYVKLCNLLLNHRIS